MVRFPVLDSRAAHGIFSHGQGPRQSRSSGHPQAVQKAAEGVARQLFEARGSRATRREAATNGPQARRARPDRHRPGHRAEAGCAAEPGRGECCGAGQARQRRWADGALGHPVHGPAALPRVCEQVLRPPLGLTATALGVALKEAVRPSLANTAVIYKSTPRVQNQQRLSSSALDRTSWPWRRSSHAATASSPCPPPAAHPARSRAGLRQPCRTSPTTPRRSRTRPGP